MKQRGISFHIGILASTLSFIFGSLNVVKAAHVSGFIKNAQRNDPVEIVVPRQYLDGRSETFRTVTDSTSSFSLEVTIPEPQVAFFYFNGDRVTIFLSPNDSLIIRTDVYQFPVTVRFGGQAGANNSILQQYLRENPQDFNDFNNTRYKIGQWWVSVEEAASLLMEKLPPEEYQKNIAHKQVAAYTLLDEYRTDHPDALSQAFVEWLTMDIIYYRAFHLLVYGQVFARAHQVQPTFFEFMDETPFDHTMISNDMWRQYMMAYLAWRQIKADPAENFWVGEYKVAGELLTGKALACTRSEIIRSGFYGDQYRELLPIYTDFFQKNTYHEYEGKIADLYAKLGRMAPGAPAPPFEGRGQNGEPVTLSQFRGKIVYVNFWATWCAACLKKMEFFNEFEPELSQNGIQIVNISIDENAENWKNALAQRSFKGHNLLASSGTEKNIAQLYGVEAVPQYFIIDQNGNFVRKALSGQPNDIRLKLLEMNQK